MVLVIPAPGAAHDGHDGHGPLVATPFDGVCAGASPRPGDNVEETFDAANGGAEISIPVDT